MLLKNAAVAAPIGEETRRPAGRGSPYSTRCGFSPAAFSLESTFAKVDAPLPPIPATINADFTSEPAAFAGTVSAMHLRLGLQMGNFLLFISYLTTPHMVHSQQCWDYKTVCSLQSASYGAHRQPCILAPCDRCTPAVTRTHPRVWSRTRNHRFGAHGHLARSLTAIPADSPGRRMHLLGAAQARSSGANPLCRRHTYPQCSKC